ncbi:tyrosine-type recombinase/integrase [Cellulosilyticum sp. WCF-2]|uniref:tyrosine-type recombinase/integrase n=1 Tax=Cellulosilyticum sp. WCF-2 TaxID=2497860 RepID=UPI000F8D073F|nr:site-specific integrase [Cellulosilyticum sp. WCF-2]QEH68177.1 site-specific integrase [Cellulosilyticum sp. WCF-2]
MAKKNANGDGSIFLRKDGRWCGAITIGLDENGVQKKKYIYDRDRDELRKKMLALQNDISINGGYVRDDIITLNQWGKTYLNEFVKSSVRPSTYDSYEVILRRHINNDSIGTMKLKDIKSFHLQKFLNSKSSLSKSYIKKMHMLLDMFFSNAVKNDLIPKNPMDAVNMPKSQKQVKDVRALTRQEQSEYMKQLESTRLKPLFLTCLFTGMRMGELMALDWDHVNFKKGEIKVEFSYKEVRMHDQKEPYWKLLKQPPKTSSGLRTIPIPQEIVKMLKSHKTAQDKLSLKLGKDEFNKEKLVFCSEVGTPLSSRNIQRTHYSICNKIGLSGIGFHALRHTFATRMIEENVPVKTVQYWIGHSSIEITYNIYVHVQEENKKAAAQVQSDLFKNLL